jgi:hypothetical protein
MLADAPSLSIKVAFQASLGFLLIAAFIPSSEINLHFITNVILLFCAKVVFSSFVVATTLSICLYDYLMYNDFSVYAAYSCVLSMITWRFSDEVRAATTAISFVWIFISPCLKKLIDMLHLL